MNCTYNWKCPPGGFPYTIRKGDTLYNIASTYKTTVERLKEVNPDVNPQNLKIGSQICIPLPLQTYPNCQTTNYYVVKKDDTIFSIARYFNVTQKLLLYSNMGIEPENIYEGMILCIPIAPPPLCVEIKSDTITLNYTNGDTDVFECINNNSDLKTTVVQKQLDSSTGGKKRLNTLIPDISICSEDSKLSSSDIVLSSVDMDYIFNKIPVGTEVVID